LVWTQSVLLPQASVAVQVREIILLPPQVLVTLSVQVTVTELHVSWAVATPVALVLVSAGHSKVRFVGQVIVGGVVSRTVMVCTQLALFPQASVAVQVRATIVLPPQVLLTLSLWLTVTALHPSRAVATPVTFVVGRAG